MDYISAPEAAKKWGITERRVQKLCEDNRIDGAIRFSRVWAIPKETKKPQDGRLTKKFFSVQVQYRFGCYHTVISTFMIRRITMRVLMVEDEKYMAKAVAEILKKNHYTVDLAHDGSDGLDYALSAIYDIIILDIMLPKMDGLTILSEIRKAGIDTPVILLTAKGQIEDKVKGLDFGADDYLTKPFHTDELLARLRALHRRKPELCNNGFISFGDIEFSPHTLVLRCGKKETVLKLKESQLLELLIANKNTVISKNTIIERVWGYDAQAEDNHVEIHISRLRKQLSQIESQITINTVRGAGYTLSEGGK